MALSKLWTVIVLLAVAIATVVVLVLTLTDGSDSGANNGDNSNNNGTSDASNSTVPVSERAALVNQLEADGDPLAVIKLLAVTGDDDESAREACTKQSTPSSQFIVAGNSLDKNATVYLCVQQARIGLLQDSATAVSPTVLSSLQVLEAAACPDTYTLVHEPRAGVVICSQSVEAATAISTGMYISLAAATIESVYTGAVRGWRVEPTTISKDPSPVVYLAVKRPVRPISSVQLATGTTCPDATWEQAGTGAITDGAVLCLQRPKLSQEQLSQPEKSLSSYLTDVAVVPGTTECGAQFNSTVKLTSRWSLCTQFATGPTSYVSDIRVINNATLTAPPSASDVRFNATVLDGEPTPVALLARWDTGISVLEPTGPAAAVVAKAKAPSTRSLADEATTPLVARVDNGQLKFKILQLADLHYAGDLSMSCLTPSQELLDKGLTCTEANTKQFVERVLDEEKPDFVVFTGDNVQVLEKDKIEKAVEYMTEAVIARGIPYAAVFGNHDDENGNTREQLAELLTGRPHSRFQWGPRTIHGVGNYDLAVHAPSDGAWGKAGDALFRMYFLDSHGYPNKTDYPGVKSYYDWIKPDQVAYYRELSAANAKVANLPAIMFFHIPLPEYDGVGAAADRTGERNEDISSGDVQSNLFSALVERGDVKATFCGHDHLNEYCFNRQGVQLCYGGGAGYGVAYGGADFARRVRAIEWTVGADRKYTISSWKQYDGAAFGKRQTEETLYRSA